MTDLSWRGVTRKNTARLGNQANPRESGQQPGYNQDHSAKKSLMHSRLFFAIVSYLVHLSQASPSAINLPYLYYTYVFQIFDHNIPLLKVCKVVFCLVFFPFSFCPCCAACGILVPRPGIEPGLPAVKVGCLNHWTALEFPVKWSLSRSEHSSD